MSGSKAEISAKQFEELVIPIHDDLYRFIFSIVNNRAAAEDALQNSLLAAYRNISNLADRAKFKPWMITIAKREAFAILRKDRREIPGTGVLIEMIRDDTEDSGADTAEDMGNDSAAAAESYGNPEDVLIRNERQHMLLEAINALDEEMRRVINLRYFNGLSFKEIAMTMNINENTARVWHMRAKKQLEKRFAMNEF